MGIIHKCGWMNCYQMDLYLNTGHMLPAFIPIEDYPLYRWKMDHFLNQWNSNETWIGRRPELSRGILDIIGERGEVKSADFKRTKDVKGTWWNWKDEKVALEQLFFMGKLMIARREKFQRVYDLTERVFPKWSEQPTISQEQSHKKLTGRTIKSLGFALTSWIPDYYRFPKTGLRKVLDMLLSEGEIQPAKLEGLDEKGYIHRDNLDLYEKIFSNNKNPLRTSILSPFDPLIWDRARLRSLFDFHYELEIYVPVSKRKLGYLLLPILHKGSIIGQMDAKAHRKSQVFEIKSLYFEAGVKIDDELISSLSYVIRDFAVWHNAKELILNNCDHPQLQKPITESLLNYHA